MDNYPQETKPQGRYSIGSAVGWIVFAIVLAIVGLIGYRTWFYYDKIRHGEIVDLPQFSSKQTQADQGTGLSSNYIDRTVFVSTQSPSFGPEPAAAKLTVVEFGDYHCPFSKEVSPTTREFMMKYADRIRFIYRDFPTNTSTADPDGAAIAARCAGDQGKFWAYHDKLYSNQPNFDEAQLKEYAGQVNLDQTKFAECLKDRGYEEAVRRDSLAARAAGVRGTPTFFFNGMRVEGALTPKAFEMIVGALMK